MFGDGNCGILIFAFLILLLLGGGGGFFGNGAAAATGADIQRAVDLNAIQQGQAAIAADVQRTAYEQIGATKDAAYNNLSEIRDIQAAVNTGFANMQTCCCETKGAIMENRYLDSQNTAAIQASIAQSDYNTSQSIQKVLDKMNETENANLRQQLNQLQMNQALCGIPKINTFAWGVTPYSPCGQYYN